HATVQRESPTRSPTGPSPSTRASSASTAASSTHQRSSAIPGAPQRISPPAPTATSAGSIPSCGAASGWSTRQRARGCRPNQRSAAAGESGYDRVEKLVDISPEERQDRNRRGRHEAEHQRVLREPLTLLAITS